VGDPRDSLRLGRCQTLIMNLNYHSVASGNNTAKLYYLMVIILHRVINLLARGHMHRCLLK
jgi:hypothetical protein